MRKTVVTSVLDFVRHVIEIAGTAAVLYMSGTMLHWLSAVILAIPAYLAVSDLVNFLVSPLYRLTPEYRVTSKVLKAIGEGEFSTALSVLKAHERWHATESQDDSYGATTETSRVDNSFAQVVSAT